MSIHSLVQHKLSICYVLAAFALLCGIGETNAQDLSECEVTFLGVPYNSLSLQASGQYVIWVDFQWDDTGTHDYTIHIYDTETEVDKTIQQAVGPDTVPDFEDGRLVWTGPDYGYGEVYLYDLSTRAISQLSNNDGTSAFTPPKINGSYVYWITGQDGDHPAIVLYNLETAEKQLLTIANSRTPQPYMQGDTLVWVDQIADQQEIMQYDVNTQTITQLTHSIGTIEPSKGYVLYHTPQVSGDLIIWQREIAESMETGYYHRVYEGFFYDGTETQLITDSYTDVVAHDPYIVWSDDNKTDDVNDDELFLYNVDTDSITQITDNDFSEHISHITDDQVVWSNFDEGIYQYDIPTGETLLISDSQYVGAAQLGDGFITWREGIDLHGGNVVLCMYQEG